MTWYEKEKNKLTGLHTNEVNYIRDLKLRRSENVNGLTNGDKLNYNEVRTIQGEVSKLNLEIDRAERREKKLRFRLQELEKVVHSIIEREGKQ